MRLNAYLKVYICETFILCDVKQCLGHFNSIVPSPACILMKQHDVRSGKHLLKTPGNANDFRVSKSLNVPRCLIPQELVSLVWVLKPPTIHNISLVFKNFFDSPEFTYSVTTIAITLSYAFHPPLWSYTEHKNNIHYPISWRHFNSFWTLAGPLVGIMCFKAHRTSGNVFILAR